jgi:hypothetical protein
MPTDFLYVFSIANDGKLKMQLWDGYGWQPAGNDSWTLGNTEKPYADSGNPTQQILKNLEL